MAKITMELIKELREKTQVGMMDCKKALYEAEGDIEKAIELLRKKGAAVAQKRAGNATDNGHVESCLSDDNKKGVLLKVSCETDFSANTVALKDFTKDVCNIVHEKDPNSVEELLEQKSTTEEGTLKDHLDELIAKIGENIKIEEFARYQVEGAGLVNAYVHPGANLGVLVMLATDKDIGEHKEKLTNLAKDICMQIVVTKPLCIESSLLDKETLDKERLIIKEQLVASGKPENMIEKIMEGKLKKYYEEVCLVNQKYIKNDKITVQQHIDEIAKETGLKISVTDFVRFMIGKE